MEEQEMMFDMRFLKYPDSKKESSMGTGAQRFWVEDDDEGFVSGELVTEGSDFVVVRRKDGEEARIRSKDVDSFRANPPKFDGVSDMAELSYLNEPSVLHNLRVRYTENIIYTYSGLFLVVVNPYKWLPIYTPKMVQFFKGMRKGEVPPHVFSLADEAYRAMLTGQKNQSILITGESGSGKTENTKKVIQYLTAIASKKSTLTDGAAKKKSGKDAGSFKNFALEDQLLAANPILEAFGNAKTSKNNNSSRFGKFIEIRFDSSGSINGGSIINYLLEKTRVVSQNSGERDFHIFYQLLSGANAKDREELQLLPPEKYSFLNQGGCYTVVGFDDAKEFADTRKAMRVMGITDEMQSDIWRVLSGILRLGNIRVAHGRNSELAQIPDTAELTVAAKMLRISPNALKMGLINPTIKAGRDYVKTHLTQAQAKFSIAALAKSLYGQVFEWLVEMINKALDSGSSSNRVNSFIGVLDIAGFEIFAKNSFEQLCINYTNEKLQQFFNNHMFKLEQEEYQREKIQWDFIDFGLDLQGTIDLIEKKPIGMLPLLEEQCIFPRATDTTFIEKLDEKHSSNNSFERVQFSKLHFRIEHYAGEVIYDVNDWLLKNKDPLESDLVSLMLNSKLAFVQRMFKDFATADSPKVSSSSSSSNKKAGGGGPGGAKFMTVSYRYREQLADLLVTLQKTQPHFIRCLLPNLQQRSDIIEADLVLNQLRCNGVLEGIRISRKGYPNRTQFEDFWKRYQCLAPTEVKKAKTEQDKCAAILAAANVDEGLWQAGLSKLFLKAGQLASMEEKREKIISEKIVVIQAWVRGWLARKAYKLLKERVASIKVIQKNVRLWIQLRHWAWWKLMQRSRAMLPMHNIKKSLKEKEKELEELRKQYEAEATTRASLEEEIEAKELDIIRYEKLLDVEKLASMETQAELEEAHIAMEEIEKQLNDEEEKKKDAERKIQNLQVKLSEADQLHEMDLDRISDVDGAKKAEEAESEKLRAKLEDSNRKMMEMSKKQSSLEQSIRDLQDDVSEAAKMKARLEKDIKSLHTNSEEQSERISEEMKAKSEVEKGKKKVENELDNVKSALIGANSTIADWQDKFVSLQNANGDLSTRLEESARLASQLDKKRRALEEQLEDTLGSLTEEEDKKGQLAGMKRKLEAEIQSLKEELSEEEEVNRSLKDAKNAVEVQVEELSRAVESGKREMAVLEERKKSLEREIEENGLALDAERTKARSSLEALTKKHSATLDNLNDTIGDLERDLDLVNKGKKKAEVEIVSLKDALSTAVTESASKGDRISDLSSQLSTATAALEEASASRTLLEREKRALSLELGDATSRANEEHEAFLSQKALVDKLRKEVSDLKDRLSESEDRVAELNSELSRVNAELAEAKRKFEDEVEKNRKLQKSVSSLESKLSSSSSLNEELRMSQLKSEKVIKRLNAELSDSTSLASESSGEAESLSKKLKRVEGELRESKRAREELAKKEAMWGETEGRMRDEMASLTSSLETANAQLSSTERALKESEVTLQDLTSERETSLEASTRLEASLKKANNELASVRLRVEEESDGREEMYQRAMSAESSLSQAERSLSSMKDENVKVSQLNEQLSRELEARERELAEEVERSTSLAAGAKKKASSAELERVKEEMASVMSERDSLKGAKRKVESALSKATSEIESLKAERSRLSDELSSIRSERDSLGGERDLALRSEGSANRKVESLARELAALKDEAAEAEREAEASGRRVRELEAEVSEASSSIEEREEELSKLSFSHESLSGELTLLRVQCEELEERARKAESVALSSESAVASLDTQLESERARSASQLSSLKKRLEGEIERVRTSAESAMGDKALWEKRAKKLEAELRTARRTSEERVRELNGANASTKRLTSDLEASRRKVEEASLTSDRLSSNLASKEAEVAQLSSSLDESIATTTELKVAVSRLEVELREARERDEDSEARVGEAEGEIESLRSDLSEAGAQLRAEIEDREAVEVKLEKAMSELRKLSSSVKDSAPVESPSSKELVAKLTQQKEELESKVSSLSAKCVEAERSEKRAKTAVEDLKRSEAREKKSSSTLLASSRKLRSKIAELEDKLEASSKIVTTLTTFKKSHADEVEDLSEELAVMEKAMKEKEKKLTRLEDELGDFMDRAEEAESARGIAEREVKELEVQLESVKREKATRSGSGSGEMRALREEVAEMREKASDEERRRIRSDKARRKAETSLNELNEKITALRTKERSLERAKAKAESEAEKAKAAASSAAKAATLTASPGGTRGEVDELKRKVRLEQRARADRERKLKEATAEIGELKEKIEVAGGSAKEIESLTKAHEEEVSELKETLSEVEESLKEREAEVSKLESEVSELRRKVGEGVESSKKFERSAKLLKRESESAKKKVEETSRQLATSQKNVDRLEKEVKEVRRELGSGSKSVGEAEKAKRKMERELKSAENKLESMRDRMSRLEDTIASKDRELRRLKREGGGASAEVDLDDLNDDDGDELEDVEDVAVDDE